MAENSYTKNEQTLHTEKPVLKICGMQQNISEVAALLPTYLGFIFWEPSKRYFSGEISSLPKSIKKVGVFVNETVENIIITVKKHNLFAVQLHGNESAEFCASVKEQLKGIQIVKVFSIKEQFDFKKLSPFETVCDFYLFDTKGKLPGGNGFVFNWNVLNKYPSTKPYFLSGGIGIDEIEKLKTFLASGASKYCHAIDVNSKFEAEPGLKEIEKLSAFIKALKK